MIQHNSDISTADTEVQLIEDEKCGVNAHQRPSNQLIAAQSRMVSNSDRSWNYSKNKATKRVKLCGQRLN